MFLSLSSTFFFTPEPFFDIQEVFFYTFCFTFTFSTSLVRPMLRTLYDAFLFSGTKTLQSNLFHIIESSFWAGVASEAVREYNLTRYNFGLFSMNSIFYLALCITS